MLNAIVPVAAQALREPREAAQTLMAMGVPRAALWPAFGLMVVLSVLIMFAGGAPVGPAGGEPMSPFGFAVVSAAVSAASVVAIWKIGRMLGGTGRFEETLLLTVFLQGIILAGQVVELFLLFLLPPLAGIFSLLLIVFAFWLNINFIAALHGFRSLWKAFGVLVLASLAMAFVLMFAAALVGVRLAGVH